VDGVLRASLGPCYLDPSNRPQPRPLNATHPPRQPPANQTPQPRTQGNWADANVALSGTGIGEEFLRRAACHDVAARVAHGGSTLLEAVRAVVHEDMAAGDGGFVGVGRDYGVAMEFNSQGMSRGCADYRGRREVAIFKE